MLVFLLNLPVPLTVGLWLVDPAARVGMLVAAGLFAAAWGFACTRWSRLAPSLIAGGTAVAASQVFPILQGLAAEAGRAVGLEAGLIREGPDPHGDAIFVDTVLGFTGGLVVGLVTGGVLMLSAVPIGMLFRRLRC
jgi:hypothetical protein